MNNDYEYQRLIYARHQDRGVGRTESTPFYHLVPKDERLNLRFRKQLLSDAMTGLKLSKHRHLTASEVQHQLWMMCSRDLLFFINAFLWTVDTNFTDAPRRPFITYARQDEILVSIDGAIGRDDVCALKARQTGLSWCCLMPMLHRWLFREMQNMLLVSRKEEYVDDKSNPKTLFWKLDFALSNLPSWLLPRFDRTKLMLENQDNGSVISGESTTGDVGRGGTFSCILLDEFAAVELSDGFRALASTQSATRCRIFNSTPQGTGNAYYEAWQLPCTKVQMSWMDVPYKAAGLYHANKLTGELEILDTRYRFPEGYEFVLDGKKRSPWYDRECLRTPIESMIAQELDMDFVGSGSQFFDRHQLSALQDEYCKPPLHVGELEFDFQTCEPIQFHDKSKGRISLWCHYDMHGLPPRDRHYVIGVDVSAGTGASNSAISVGDAKTGEKVAEFIYPSMRAPELAKLAVALARWFCGPAEDGAYLAWEANGPGRDFENQVLEIGYGNIYFRRKETNVSRSITNMPGWWTTRENKQTLLSEYARALYCGEFVNRSHRAVGECQDYVFLSDGSLGHVRSRSCLDPSGARDNHGDIVIADALCWMALKEKKEKAPDEISLEYAPVGSLAWRIKEHKEELEKDRFEQSMDIW